MMMILMMTKTMTSLLAAVNTCVCLSLFLCLSALPCVLLNKFNQCTVAAPLPRHAARPPCAAPPGQQTFAQPLLLHNLQYTLTYLQPQHSTGQMNECGYRWLHTYSCINSHINTHTNTYAQTQTNTRARAGIVFIKAKLVLHTPTTLFHLKPESYSTRSLDPESQEPLDADAVAGGRPSSENFSNHS